MTVVAVYRGKPGTHNAMVADTICTNGAEPASWTDKLSVVFVGDTYATAAGDPSVINGLRFVVDDLDPRRPNLRDPGAFHAILSAAERMLALRERSTSARHESNGSALFICTRDSVFFWVAGYDSEARQFERPPAPRELREGECFVFWGSDIRRPDLREHEGALQRDPITALETLIHNEDASQRAAAKTGLRYRLDGVFSGVVLPHDAARRPQRKHPFSLPELLVREEGAPHLEVLADAAFMAYEPPAAS